MERLRSSVLSPRKGEEKDFKVRETRRGEMYTRPLRASLHANVISSASERRALRPPRGINTFSMKLLLFGSSIRKKDPKDKTKPLTASFLPPWPSSSSFCFHFFSLSFLLLQNEEKLLLSFRGLEMSAVA